MSVRGYRLIALGDADPENSGLDLKGLNLVQISL